MELQTPLRVRHRRTIHQQPTCHRNRHRCIRVCTVRNCKAKRIAAKHFDRWKIVKLQLISRWISFSNINLNLFNSNKQTGIAYRSGTRIGGHQSISQSDFFQCHYRWPSTKHVPVITCTEFQLWTTIDHSTDKSFRYWNNNTSRYSQPPRTSTPSARNTICWNNTKYQSFIITRRTWFNCQIISGHGFCRRGRPSVDIVLRSSTEASNCRVEEST